MSSFTFDKIVPVGQNFVFDDMSITLTLKEWVAFSLCLIDVSVNSRKYCESCLGCSLGSHISGLLDGVEDGSAPCSGNLREEAVLYGVPLGAVRWIVGDSNVDAQSLGRLHKVPFELPAPCIVGFSSIAKDADTLYAWILMAEVLLLLLLQIVMGKLRCVVAHTESYVASVPVDIVDAMRHELLIAPLAISHRQSLYGLASGVPFCLYNLPDGIEAYLYMLLLREYLLDLRGSQPEPFRVGILWESCDVKFNYLAEDVDI